MVQSKGTKAGYVKGVGRTFAPSLKADWVDEFNQMLAQEPDWSRNRLTEHLIKKGLDSKRTNNESLQLSIPSEGLTEQQQVFLESEEGSVFIGNAIRLLLMQPGTNGMSQFNVQPPSVSEKEEPAAAEENPPVISRKRENKPSALERARNKLKRQNI